jgi:NDP-sugar pyrophosphorylase family protein
LWLDIGTFESYMQANFALLMRRYASGDDWLWGERVDCALFKDLVYLSKTAKLGQGVDLFHRVIVMRNAKIGSGCRLQNCLVLPDSNIGDDCRLTDCIIGPRAQVSAGSTVSNVVVISGEDDTPYYPEATMALH